MTFMPKALTSAD